MLKADESVTSWPTDIVWAKDARPNKETVEPSRVKARSDKLDPMLMISTIDIAEPKRVHANTENVDPSRSIARVES
jgi:hypothetical protein